MGAGPRRLDHPVLVDPALALELRRARRSRGGGRRRRSRRRPPPRRPGSASAIMRSISARSATVASRRPARRGPPRASRRCGTNFTRGRPSGLPRSCSAASIASQPAKVTMRRGCAPPAAPRSPCRSAVAGAGRPRAGSRSSKRWSTVSWASFLLVPITPLGPRLIQPTAYWPSTWSPVSGSSDAAALVADDAAVARRTGRPRARCPCSRSSGRRGRTRSSRARRCRAARMRAGLVAMQLVAADDDPLDLAVALDLDRRAEEAQHDPPAACPRARAAANSVKISTFLRAVMSASSDSRYSRLSVVELAVGGVDDDVGVDHLAQLADLGVREGGLGRAAAAEDDDLLDAAVGEGVDRVLGGVGLLELLAVEAEHPGDVGGDVAVADHDGALAGEVELVVGEVGVGVVPGDELGGGVAAREVLAGDPEVAVGRRRRRRR